MVATHPAAHHLSPGSSFSNGHSSSQQYGDGDGNGNGDGSVRNNNNNNNSIKSNNNIKNGIDKRHHFYPLYEGSSIDRQEFVRLTLQTLYEAGLSQTAASLEKESGIVLEKPAVTRFRIGVLNGDWNTVLDLLDDIDTGNDQVVIRFLINQQRFLEYLEQGDTKRALVVLRKDLAPLNHDQERLHVLSSLMMCTNPTEVRKRSNWDGANGQSRQKLLQELQSSISASIMIPHRRLETLLDQAREYQRVSCPYHTSNASGNLYTDHECDPSLFPSTETHVLSEHKDEVWVLAFSPSGSFLASGSKDKSIIVWRTSTFGIYRTLVGHDDGIYCLAWSPDESYLCSSAENIIKVWNVKTGDVIATIEKHTYQISSLAWNSDSSAFYSFGLDAVINTFLPNGVCVESSSTGNVRFVNGALTPDDKRLVLVGLTGETTESQRQIVIYDTQGLKVESVLTASRELTSVSITKDSRFALINQAPDELNLYDLGYSPPKLIRQYHGQQQAKHVIGNAFGGPDESLVISGSEDSNIYIWNREIGNLVDTLSGHSLGSVNSVSWNPTSRVAMLASCGDDGTIRIWEGIDLGSEQQRRRQQQQQQHSHYNHLHQLDHHHHHHQHQHHYRNNK